MPSVFSRPSRRHLLADNVQLREHLSKISTELQERVSVSGVVQQPLFLPTTVLQARIELNLVRADRTRMERTNDRLREQLQQKNADLVTLRDELRQARLALLEAPALPDMSVPWQPMSSSAV